MKSSNDKNTVHHHYYHHHYYHGAAAQNNQNKILDTGKAIAAGMLIEKGLHDKNHRKGDFFLAWLFLGCPGLVAGFEIAGIIGIVIALFISAIAIVFFRIIGGIFKIIYDFFDAILNILGGEWHIPSRDTCLVILGCLSPVTLVVISFLGLGISSQLSFH